MPTVSIISKAPYVLGLLPFDRRELSLLLKRMLQQHFCNTTNPLPAIELALVDDAQMEQLNWQSLGLFGPTNILSFPAESQTEFLGWAALAPATAKRESMLYGQDEKKYTIRLLAHGLAHLLGYDHGVNMDACTEKLEKAVSDYYV